MTCAVTQGPAVAAMSAAVTAAKRAGADALPVQPCEGCGPTDMLVGTAEKAMLQAVICCCRTAAYKQMCVKDTLDAADTLLGHRSRYKAEVSYDMTKRPPAPLMHRVGGVDTTQRSTHWQSRAWEIPGYRPGKGMVRRPDVVISADPTLPPTQDNIDRVVEIKFGNDRPGEGQIPAYERIAGSPDKLDQMSDASCPDEDGEPVPVPVPVTAPATEPERDIPWGEIGAVTLLGVATVALALVPFDGPAGEAVAGAAFAARLGRLLAPAAAAGM
ncbi:VRR-NUC domain-containing protein [Rhodovulum sp. DZ06]|uniref:VRR-NUC domain-containing protein n=1 Tax=Rhodovulum sp. DZ06 TaxID=3425126 RepID=UPI003D33B872